MTRIRIKMNYNMFCVFGILTLIIALLGNSVLHGGDFRVFYVAGERFLSKFPIYQIGDGGSPFKYHPVWSVFFSSWALIPFKLSLFLFTAMNLMFWSIAYGHWAKLLKYPISTLNYFIVLLLGFNALSAETAYGQLNGFLFWGATCVFLLMEDESPKPILAGILLAFLISLKLNFGVLVFYLLRRNSRSLLGVALGAVLIHGVLILAYGNLLNYELYQSWITLVLGQSEGQFNTFETQGILRLCYVIFGPAYAKVIWAAVLLIFIGVGLLLTNKQRRYHQVLDTPVAATACYWFTVLFLFSPLTWWYHILYLFPLAFMLLKFQLNKKLRILTIACLVIFAGIGFNTVGREGFFIFKYFMGYFVAGIGLLVGYFFGDRFAEDVGAT